jgi:RNA polymerase sigma factor (sigma-70 family)
MSGSTDGKTADTKGLPPELMQAVYAQLRELASLYLAGRRGTVLQATSLVHEAFIRLARSGGKQWEDETHFAAVAATVMRCVLVDEIRTRTRRGGTQGTAALDLPQRIGLDPGTDGSGEAQSCTSHNSSTLDLLALDEALTELARLSERQVRVVELRYFGGLSVPQTAEFLGVSTRTVENDWSIARAWLKRRLDGFCERREPEP